jgi:hypothetical protein
MEAAKGWFYSDWRDRMERAPLVFFDSHNLRNGRGFRGALFILRKRDDRITPLRWRQNGHWRAAIAGPAHEREGGAVSKPEGANFQIKLLADSATSAGASSGDQIRQV